MRKREGCGGTETFTSIKSQEIDKNIGRFGIATKQLTCSALAADENIESNDSDSY